MEGFYIMAVGSVLLALLILYLSHRDNHIKKTK